MYSKLGLGSGKVSNQKQFPQSIKYLWCQSQWEGGTKDVIILGHQKCSNGKYSLTHIFHSIRLSDIGNYEEYGILFGLRGIRSIINAYSN